jgi:hypothetical protein
MNKELKNNTTIPINTGYVNYYSEESYLVNKGNRLKLSIDKWGASIKKCPPESVQELLIYTEWLNNCRLRLTEVTKSLMKIDSSLSTHFD